MAIIPTGTGRKEQPKMPQTNTPQGDARGIANSQRSHIKLGTQGGNTQAQRPVTQPPSSTGSIAPPPPATPRPQATGGMPRSSIHLGNQQQGAHPAPASTQATQAQVQVPAPQPAARKPVPQQVAPVQQVPQAQPQATPNVATSAEAQPGQADSTGKEIKPNALVERLRNLFRMDTGYARHPRTSPVWRWWRPLITAPLAVVYFVLILILMMIAGMVTGILSPEQLTNLTENMETMPQSELYFSLSGAYITLGGLASMTLAVALALWTSRERPFGTVMSVFGGPRARLFAKAVVFAFVSLGLAMFLEVSIANGGSIPKIHPLHVDRAVIALIAVVLPLQCIAEEVLFRGYVFQTFASWLPRKGLVFAIVGESLLFMTGHAYDILGQIAILVTGLTYGWLAEKTGGIESGCAFHIANNCIAFILMGLGLTDITSNVPLLEAIMDSVSTILMPVLFVAWGMRRGWIGDAETKQVGSEPCRMFGSQHDALMWEHIQEAQLADWNRFMSQMPSVDQVQPMDVQYVDGEGYVVGVGDAQYDDNQIVSLMDTGTQKPVTQPEPYPGTQAEPASYDAAYGQQQAYQEEPPERQAPKSPWAHPVYGDPTWQGPQDDFGDQSQAYAQTPLADEPGSLVDGIPDATEPATPAGNAGSYSPNAPVPGLGNLL